jgi:hypothetical protein
VEDLYALLREDAAALDGQFRKASIEGRGTSQEVADFREHALQEFVSRFFPFPHRVTKGKIRDSSGRVSDSVDCVVCGPSHPYTIDSRGKFTLLFADGVDAAIEVKPDISAKAELYRGLEQGLTVKALRRLGAATLRKNNWIVERAHRVPFVIFAMKCKSDALETGREIMEFYQSRSTPPLQQADFVAVNNVGLFMNCVDAELNGWHVPHADKTGWWFEAWADDALAGFVWRMHNLALTTVPFSESDQAMLHYLRPTRGMRIVPVDGRSPNL